MKNGNEKWLDQAKLFWWFHVSIEVNANALVFAEEIWYSELVHGAGALSVNDTASFTTMAVNIKKKQIKK